VALARQILPWAFFSASSGTSLHERVYNSLLNDPRWCEADPCLQNLIPLLLRPLRLLASSENVRSARIVLLKATHLPFVAAIWAYEHFAERKRKSGFVTMSGPETPITTTTKRPLRFPMNPPRSSAGLQGTAESNGNTPARASRPQTRSGPSEPDPQLKALVIKLTTQVAELTSMVAQLQQQGSEGSRPG
jgi:hypothetical protein